MTLNDLYGDDEIVLKGTQADLMKGRSLIEEWVAGGKIDPNDAYYIGMTILGISNAIKPIKD